MTTSTNGSYRPKKKHKPYVRVTPHVYDRMIKMREQGHTQQEIADALKLTTGTVSRNLNFPNRKVREALDRRARRAGKIYGVSGIRPDTHAFLKKEAERQDVSVANLTDTIVAGYRLEKKPGLLARLFNL